MSAVCLRLHGRLCWTQPQHYLECPPPPSLFWGVPIGQYGGSLQQILPCSASPGLTCKRVRAVSNPSSILHFRRGTPAHAEPSLPRGGGVYLCSNLAEFTFQLCSHPHATPGQWIVSVYGTGGHGPTKYWKVGEDKCNLNGWGDLFMGSNAGKITGTVNRTPHK